MPPVIAAPPAAARPVPGRRARPLGRRRRARAAGARGGGGRVATRRRSTPATRPSSRPPGCRCTRRPTASSCSPASTTVVKSPGVPQEAPVVAGARRRGSRVVGELEIGWRLLPNDFVAITGSNGKTTTTELVGHIHREAGRPVVVAGNVGTALTILPGHDRAGRGRRLRGVVVPARGHRGLRARGGGPAQPRRGPSRPPRHVRRLPRGEAAVFARQPRRRWRSRRRALGRTSSAAAARAA